MNFRLWSMRPQWSPFIPPVWSHSPSLESLDYLFDLYKQVEIFWIGYRDMILFASFLLLPAFVVASRNLAFHESPHHPLKHRLHSSQISLLRNQSEGNLSDGTSSASLCCWACGEASDGHGDMTLLWCWKFSSGSVDRDSEGIQDALCLRNCLEALACRTPVCILVCRSREPTNIKSPHNWGLWFCFVFWFVCLIFLLDHAYMHTHLYMYILFCFIEEDQHSPMIAIIYWILPLWFCLNTVATFLLCHSNPQSSPLSRVLDHIFLRRELKT